jgi:hypothetical protein
MRAGTASHDDTDATIYGKDIRGVSSSGTRIPGACYSGMTPSGRLWMRRRSLSLPIQFVCVVNTLPIFHPMAMIAKGGRPQS